MPIAKESGGNFTPVPPGSHIARCIACISLGTQPSDRFVAAYKVMLTWEVPSERVQFNGQEAPMTISKEYTLSLGKKSNLRKDMEGWRGREFTANELQGIAVEKVLDCPCMLSVIHKQSASGSTYASITGISKMPKGISCPERFHKLVHYEIEQGRDETFKALPEWVRKKIEQCEEWVHPPIDQEQPDDTKEPVNAVNGQAPAQVVEDDVPF